MILTQEEIDAIDQSMCGERECITPFVRAIEQAVIAKLSQGVDIKPVALIDGNNEQVHFQDDAMYHYWIGRNCTPMYLESAITASRIKALEDAAVLMEEQDTQAPKYNAKAIRVLKVLSHPKGE